MKKEKISARDARRLWVSRVVIWIVIVLVMFPVLWIVMSSFSAGDSFSSLRCFQSISAQSIIPPCFGRRISCCG